MVRTTPPKEEKVDKSSVEAPTAQALVAQLGSKVSNDNLADDDHLSNGLVFRIVRFSCPLIPVMPSCTWP
jgi:hypothetical protein